MCSVEEKSARVGEKSATIGEKCAAYERNVHRRREIRQRRRFVLFGPRSQESRR